MTYRAVKCPCRHISCTNWHITIVADLQGVSFTQEQAIAVALILNQMDAAEDRDLDLPEPEIIREFGCDGCDRVLLEEDQCKVCGFCVSSCCEHRGDHH